MTKFTPDTPVAFLGYNGEFPARILQILEGVEPSIVAVVTEDGEEEAILFYSDGSRDNDGANPRLIVKEPETVLFINFLIGDDGKFVRNATLCETETSRASGRRVAQVRVVFEGHNLKSMTDVTPAPADDQGALSI